VIDEAYTNPELVRTAPHNQAIHQVDGSRVNEPDAWATTWRAHRRKSATVGAR
jgi:glycine dehydrogenase subunit 2